MKEKINTAEVYEHAATVYDGSLKKKTLKTALTYIWGPREQVKANWSQQGNKDRCRV